MEGRRNGSFICLDMLLISMKEDLFVSVTLPVIS